MAISFFPLGERAITVELAGGTGTECLAKIRRFSRLMEQQPPRWLTEWVPAYTTITVFYDPFLAAARGLSPYENVKAELEILFDKAETVVEPPARTMEIPVCYGGEFGPDLEFVARRNGLSEREVISIHTAAHYTVAMIGFSPGFPFLEGMPEAIAAPRKTSPRLRIPERSVGIAGAQTGVYPIQTPGGWQLIGRTPLRLFQPEEEDPVVLRQGDLIRFVEISAAIYREQEAAYASHS